MSRRPVTPRSTEPSSPRARGGIAPARPFDVDVDRPKRIDHLIDYFGSGDVKRTAIDVGMPPSGGWRVDADDV